MKLKFWQKEKREDVKPVPIPHTVHDTAMAILNLCNTFEDEDRRKILTDVVYMAFDKPHHLRRNVGKRVTA